MKLLILHKEEQSLSHGMEVLCREKPETHCGGIRGGLRNEEADTALGAAYGFVISLSWNCQLPAKQFDLGERLLLLSY